MKLDSKQSLSLQIIQQLIINATFISKEYEVARSFKPSSRARMKFLQSFLEIFHSDRPRVFQSHRSVHRQLCRRFAEMCEVSAGKSFGLFRDRFQIDCTYRPVAQVKLEDSLASFQVWRQNQKHSIQSARPSQCSIHVPRMIGRCQNENTFIIVCD